MDPELEEFPALLLPVTLTCGAEGFPEPNITWYKDGVVLEKERSKNLVFQEVDIEDRGWYRCSAENFDPSSQMVFRDDSKDVVLNIEGTY